MNQRSQILRTLERQLPATTLRWERAKHPQNYDEIAVELHRMLSEGLFTMLQEHRSRLYIIAELSVDGIAAAKRSICGYGDSAGCQESGS